MSSTRADDTMATACTGADAWQRLASPPPCRRAADYAAAHLSKSPDAEAPPPPAKDATPSNTSNAVPSTSDAAASSAINTQAKHPTSVGASLLALLQSQEQQLLGHVGPAASPPARQGASSSGAQPVAAAPSRLTQAHEQLMSLVVVGGAAAKARSGVQPRDPRQSIKQVVAKLQGADVADAVVLTKVLGRGGSGIVYMGEACVALRRLTLSSARQGHTLLTSDHSTRSQARGVGCLWPSRPPCLRRRRATTAAVAQPPRHTCATCAPSWRRPSRRPWGTRTWCAERVLHLILRSVVQVPCTCAWLEGTCVCTLPRLSRWLRTTTTSNA